MGRGSRCKENGGSFSYSYEMIVQVKQVSFLHVSLFPVNVNLVVYLGIVHRVIRGAGVSLFNFPR